MGRKKNRLIVSSTQSQAKLSAQKRHELNHLVDCVLKICFVRKNIPSEQWSQYVEVRALLDRIQAVESKLKANEKNIKTRIDTIIAFQKWAKENGAEFDGTEIQEFSGFGLGLKALKPFKKGQLLAKIPKVMILTEEALDGTLLSALKEVPILGSMSNIKLALALILEKLNPESFWKPYIDLLPVRYTTVLDFSMDEMKGLKGSNLLPKALNHCISIVRQYGLLYKCLQKMSSENEKSQSKNVFGMLKENFTYDLYRWAVSTVMTRQNGIPKSEKCGNEEQSDDFLPSLIPLWDLINHKNGEITTAFNTANNCLESSAFSDFGENDQIFMFYGNRSTAEFLLYNGFFCPDNNNDYVTLRLGLSNSDPLVQQRTELLQLLNIQKQCDFHILTSPNYISSELLAFARVFNMENEQLQHWISSTRAPDLLHIDCALDTSLETKTWVFLETRLSLLLKAFSTSLEADEATLLKQESGEIELGQVNEMLLKYRIFEKRMLTDTLVYVKQRSKM